MEFRNGQVAVTGASGGMGRALCAHLAALGLSVFALDRVAIEPLAVLGLWPRRHGPIERRGGSVCRLRDGTGTGRPGLLRGIVEDDVAAEDMPIELFDSVLAVNLRGLYLSCQAFGRRLLARGGGASSTLPGCQVTIWSISLSTSAHMMLPRPPSQPCRSPWRWWGAPAACV